MLAHRKKTPSCNGIAKMVRKNSLYIIRNWSKNKMQHSKWPYPHPIMSIVGEDFWLVSWGRDAAIVLLPPGKNAWPPREMPSMCKTNLATSDSVGNNVRAPAGDMLLSAFRNRDGLKCLSATRAARNLRALTMAPSERNVSRACCWACAKPNKWQLLHSHTCAHTHKLRHTRTHTLIKTFNLPAWPTRGAQAA